MQRLEFHAIRNAMHMRPATMADAALLFEWRNDPGTRAMCLDTAPILWDDHLRWLERVLADPSCELSLYELDGVPCGTTRLDRGEDEAELSTTVAPTMRGRGVAKAMYRIGLPSGRLTGRIRRENIASQRLVSHFGFVLVEDGPVQLWVRPARESAAEPQWTKRATTSR